MKIFEQDFFGNHCRLEISNDLFSENCRLVGRKVASFKKFVHWMTTEAFSDLGVDCGSDYRLSEFLCFCKQVLKKDNLRIVVLAAHGGSRQGEWTYADGFWFPKHRSMKEWLARYDGDYDLILIQSCNPGHHFLRPRISITIVPTDNVGPMLSIAGVEHRLFIPGLINLTFNRRILNRLIYLKLWAN